MRVSVLQENLAKGLSIVSRAVATRPTLPILSNVLISTDDGRLKLSATNLELGVVARIGAKVDEEGAITVPARTFQDFVNTLPPERVDLTLDPKTNSLKLRCGTTESNFRGITADDYPPVPEADAETGMAVPAPAFREMIDHVVFAAAREDNRPILTGVSARFEGETLTLAAADGYRLAIRTAELESPVSAPVSLIIPARTLHELARVMSPDDAMVYISIPSGRSQVMFHLSQVDVVSQLIEGSFPDIEKIIPKTHSTMTIVPTEELLRACKRSEIFAREASYTMRLSITPGESSLVPGLVTISAQSQEKGDNEGRLDAQVSGSPVEISFNVRYLIDVLNVINEDQVVLETGSNSSPGVIRPVNRQDFTHVIMPMASGR
jgi:DNA polymerase-3 subunit beta